MGVQQRVSTGFNEEHPWLHVDTQCAMMENIGKRNENVNANSERKSALQGQME